MNTEESMQAEHLALAFECNRQLRAENEALKAATIRPNPADFTAWSQKTLAEFAQQVWDENKRLRFQLQAIACASGEQSKP